MLNSAEMTEYLVQLVGESRVECTVWLAMSHSHKPMHFLVHQKPDKFIIWHITYSFQEFSLSDYSSLEVDGHYTLHSKFLQKEVYLHGLWTTIINK